MLLTTIISKIMGDFEMFIRETPLISVPFYLILVAIFGIIIFVWLKGDLTTIRKLPIILATLHFVLAVILSIIILVLLKYDGEAGMLWYIFYYLDWPVSFVLIGFQQLELYRKIWISIVSLPFIKVIPLQLVGNILNPFINFGILGTIQYYIWGLVVSKILLFLKK